MDNFTPKEIGQIVTAYTGIMCSTMPDFHEYAEKILDRPIFTHEFGDMAVAKLLKEKSKADFLRLAKWCSSED